MESIKTIPRKPPFPARPKPGEVIESKREESKGYILEFRSGVRIEYNDFHKILTFTNHGEHKVKIHIFAKGDYEISHDTQVSIECARYREAIDIIDTHLTINRIFKVGEKAEMTSPPESELLRNNVLARCVRIRNLICILFHNRNDDVLMVEIPSLKQTFTLDIDGHRLVSVPDQNIVEKAMTEFSVVKVEDRRVSFQDAFYNAVSKLLSPFLT